MKELNNSMFIALMDEYARALEDLKLLVIGLSDIEFKKERDLNPLSRLPSIKIVIQHVVEAGLVYANEIAVLDDLVTNNLTIIKTITSPNSGIAALNNIIPFTTQVLAKIETRTNEEIMSFRIRISENEFCNIEQQLEHAIVHVLRHRRQIENWLKS